jgi:FixJ family two-component response regulator
MSETDETSEVFIVDDDTTARNQLFEMFTEAGYQVVRFVDGASFVAVARQRTPACIILDIHLPDRSGLDILKDIDARNYPAPIFISSERGDIPSAVQAIKSGAFDFFEKQLGASTLVARVNAAVEAWQHRRRAGAEISHLRLSFPGSELLTPRERDVLAQIAGSATSKEAALNLDISPRTVEIHRSHIMHKLGAKNPIDLARKVLGRERTTGAADGGREWRQSGSRPPRQSTV